MPEIRVLLTAFDAFPGAPVNPTMALARLVQRRDGRRLARLGIALHTAILPVEYAGAEDRAAGHIARIGADVVLHLGLAARRKRLSFETRARNRLSVLHPDAARRHAGRMLIDAKGAPLRASRAPAARCVSAIVRAGAVCAVSIDAGDYLCNQTLYASLRTNAPIVAFLHIPRPRPARATLARMAAGTVAAVIEMAKHARRLDGLAPSAPP